MTRGDRYGGQGPGSIAIRPLRDGRRQTPLRGHPYVGVARYNVYPRRYYEPSYDRYRYCRPYRHYHTRYPRAYRDQSYWHGYHGFLGVGYRPAYGYLDSAFCLPARRYHVAASYSWPFSYSYPRDRWSWTTVIRTDPEVAYVSTDDDSDVYYAENIYMDGGGGGSYQSSNGAGYLSAPDAPAVGPTIVEAPPFAPAQPAVTVRPGEEQLVPPSATASAPPDPTLVDHGNAAFNAGDYHEAARFYVGAVLADDGDAYARLFYGLAQFAQGDIDLAAMALRRALSVEPELIDHPIDLRTLYPEASIFDGHTDRLAYHVGANPEDRNGLFVLGYVRYATAQPELALESLQALIALDPQDGLARELRDAVQRVLGAARMHPDV